MSATYDPTWPEKKDEVRARIGDKDEDNPFLEDEEIKGYLSRHSNDVLLTSIACVEAIIAELAREVNYQASTLRQDAGQAYEHYKDLLIDLRKEANKEIGTPIFVHSGDDEKAPELYVGIHDNRKQVVEEDEFDAQVDR